MAGLFDDLPEAKSSVGLFDDLPDAPADAVADDRQEAGRWTRAPRGIKEAAQFMVGGVLHPIRQTETAIESVASDIAGKPMRLMVRPSELLERKAIDFPRIPEAKTTPGK